MRALVTRLNDGGVLVVGDEWRGARGATRTVITAFLWALAGTLGLGIKGVAIVRSNQVWSTDITYIRLLGGFVYLAAVIDWFSRYVLAWELSTTLEVGFCVAVVERALTIQRPEIFNTDQGVQFTSAPFQAPLLAAQVKLSMDGRGRLFDNIFVERLWRSVKYEEVFLHDYQNVGESRRGLGQYFPFYNCERPHQALGYRTPHNVYFGVP